MFDISWTEFLLIGVVALIVIGPKELPAVMRTMGQWTRKIRSMAADFQQQFEREMREAEFTDLKKQVDEVEQGIKSYDPLKDVRSDVEAIGMDLETSLAQEPASADAAAQSAGMAAPAGTDAAAEASAATEASAAAEASPVAAPQPAELPGPEPVAELPRSEPVREQRIVAAAIAEVAPQPVEQAEAADSPRRTA